MAYSTLVSLDQAVYTFHLELENQKVIGVVRRFIKCGIWPTFQVTESGRLHGHHPPFWSSWAAVYISADQCVCTIRNKLFTSIPSCTKLHCYNNCTPNYEW